MIRDIIMAAANPGFNYGAKWVNRRTLSALDAGVGPANVRDMCYVGGYYTAVCAGGRVARSTNLVTWTFVDDMVGRFEPNAVASAGGTVVAVGEGGGIWSSSNGTDWTQRTCPAGYGGSTTFDIETVVWTGSIFVAAGVAGNCFTSADGTTWAYQSGLYTAIGSAARVDQLMWTGTHLVARGFGFTNIYRSTNGVSWTGVGTAYTAMGATIYAMGNSGATVLAYGYPIPHKVIKSTDSGATWSAYSTFSASGSFSSSDKLSTDGTKTFIVHGTSIDYQAAVGGAWVHYVPGSTPYVVYPYISTQASNVGGILVSSTAVVWGNAGKVMTSTDNVTWTAKPALSGLDAYFTYAGAARALAYDGTTIVAAGDYGRVATVTPTALAAGTLATNRGVTLNATGNWESADAVRAAVWAGPPTNLFVLTGDNGRVASSPDGTTWTYRSALRATAWGTTAEAYALATTGTTTLVVGASGQAATSTDGGVTWTYQSGLSSTAWSTTIAYAAVYGNGKFIVAGASGKVATSSDGATWTNQTGLSSTAWSTTTAYGLGYSSALLMYAVVGASGKIATSTDGATWTSRTSPVATTLYSVTWADDRFVAVGADGTAVTSTDGVEWVDRSSRLNALSDWSGGYDALAVIWVGDRFVVSGDSGRLASSP